MHHGRRFERLCRYVCRPAIAEQRLSIDGDGLIVYELQRSFSDGTTHVLFEPHDLIARPAALVPRTRASGVVGQRNLSPSRPLALDFKHPGW